VEIYNYIHLLQSEFGMPWKGKESIRIKLTSLGYRKHLGLVFQFSLSIWPHYLKLLLIQQRV